MSTFYIPLKQTLEQLLSGKLNGTRKLQLSCGLTEFPKEILDLEETLEYLDLSGNRLDCLPDDFGRLKKLRIAFFSNNDFTTFPVCFASCLNLEIIGFKANKISRIPEGAFPKKLRWLILTNNDLKELPSDIGECHLMQKLMLAGNQLNDLPLEMGRLKNLQLLRISANNFKAIPNWLQSLPLLSWLAIAGNPISIDPPVVQVVPEISWNMLSIGKLLGEGASGLIFQADWKEMTGIVRQVAVKVFKGEVTSDGLPADEMNACIAAQEHEHIVKVLGRITGHPESKPGLVLELIPENYTNLGGPPDFTTCTRDTFKTGTIFSLKSILKISEGISSASAHLHARGISHGDLYAHNILIDQNAHALFGDFGAATLYNTKDTGLSPFIEKVEVRAFGCLLEDLLDHINQKDGEHVLIPLLISLKEQCMHRIINERPFFLEISEHIKNIALHYSADILN